MNLGRVSKRKGRGKVVGKVVSHESKTRFKEDRNGGKLYSIKLGRGSQRKGSGEITSTDWLSSTYIGRKGKTMTNAVRTSVTN